MLRFLSALLACSLCLPSAVRAAGDPVDPSYLTNLHWRMIGPFRGGRTLAATGVPGDPEHFYFGAVDGGVWESFDAGRTWKPIFDTETVASIGSIAVAPSDPKTLYVGTGEADMRSDIAYGNGMYKSSDGGSTWRHLGLDDTRQIGSIAIDPHDANVVYVAALGHQYGPNAQRGVFKTTDGGQTWNNVLFKDDNTGATAVIIDPSDSNVVYAALWQTRRPPWNVYPPSNGPGSGLYKSADGGKTWTQLHGGLPDRVGRIGLSISVAAPHRIYANVDSDAAHGGIYRSDDAGATWTHTDGEPRIWQRGWYFSGITADPRDPDVVYVMDTAVYRSTNGGKSFDAFLGDPTGDDYHSLSIDPNDSRRMILSSDQGTIVSVNGGKTWSSWYNQPTGQFYHVTADDAFPFWVYGAQQDSVADMQAIATTRSRTLSNQDFFPIDTGGESGTLAPDPREGGGPHALVYGSGSVGSGQAVSREIPISAWEQTIDPTLEHPGTVWRGTWTLPIVFSLADRRSLYYSSQQIFRTRNGGQTWKVVSPDLSRADEGTPSNLDPATLADNANLKRHGVVYAIAPSPVRASEVWAGTDDGYVWITRDDSAHWQNVTPPALTPWSKAGVIEASRFDPAVAYVAVDRHRLDDYKPYIYRTRDYGRTWTAIATGIPDGSFVNVVREDSKRRGLLYAGTERAVYVSFDDGDRWQTLQLNMPPTSIRDIAVRGDDVAVATHGRAFWVLDDVASLRQLGSLNAGETHLFAPAGAYRVRPGSYNGGGTPLPLDEPQADNPGWGLNIDYYLPDVPRTPVVVDILGSGGNVIRHWSSNEKPKPTDPKSVPFTPFWIVAHPVPEASAGAHRFVWDFREGSADGLLMPPGAYVVRLSVNGKIYTASATVRRDPRAPVTDAGLRVQFALASEVQSLRGDVAHARDRAKELRHAVAPSVRRAFDTEVIGETPAENPDDSVGAYSHDVSSFLFLDVALENLVNAIESADAAPTPEMRSAYLKLDAIYRQTLARERTLQMMR
jgi:photosystem II stability/assembly factor-like uncharacterized protein